MKESQSNVEVLSADKSTVEEYKSSMGKFNYALRPAKNIERKMICETFASLSCIAPISKYRYIGFGSVEFVDFSLFHQRLGLNDMISIEREKDAEKQKRVAANLPYSCIKMEWGKSNEVLPRIGWKKMSIVWLDYDCPLNTDILEDIRLVSGSVKSGSVLVVTVDAKPKKIEEKESNVHMERYNELVSQVGKKKIPLTVKGKDLAKWGLAVVSREIINNEIAQSLVHRNGPIEKDLRVEYNQLFNFHYADGANMLTVGGLFLDSKDKAKLPSDIFSYLNFIRTDESAYSIETPILTLRELRLLDSLLPCKSTNNLKWIPESERKRYGKVYRYFPTFTEVEA